MAEKQKSKSGKLLIVLISILALILIVFVGYQFYRYPATFRNLKNDALSSEQTEQLKQEILEKDDLNVLVVYYSYSGTTKNAAEAISNYMNSDIFEIKTISEYSNVYAESNSQIRKKVLPELVGSPENLSEYDIVFIGFPVWWHATPPPINAFLESNDLKGKLVIPFCTSGGSDIDEPMPTFLDSCDGLAVCDGKLMNNSSLIADWIQQLGLEGLIETSDES